MLRERERRGDLGDGGMSGVVSSHSDDLNPRCQQMLNVLYRALSHWANFCPWFLLPTETHFHSLSLIRLVAEKILGSVASQRNHDRRALSVGGSMVAFRRFRRWRLAEESDVGGRGSVVSGTIRVIQCFCVYSILCIKLMCLNLSGCCK
jgi:hypothetical protein